MLGFGSEPLSLEQVIAMCERDFPDMLWLLRLDEREGYFANLVAKAPPIVAVFTSAEAFNAARDEADAIAKSPDRAHDYTTTGGPARSFPAYGPTHVEALARAYRKAMEAGA